MPYFPFYLGQDPALGQLSNHGTARSIVLIDDNDLLIVHVTNVEINSVLHGTEEASTLGCTGIANKFHQDYIQMQLREIKLKKYNVFPFKQIDCNVESLCFIP